MSSRDATSCGGINIEHLHQVLSDLTSNPNPHVPNPPDVPKRASVALILRIHPRYGHWPDHPVEPQRLPSGTQPLSTTDHLDHFFQQDWIRQGDPEILFIKRAARQGDRWTSHVAFPGGKRDPVDEDDVAAAVRETWEEVGLDLAGEHAIYVGNLAERVVTTSWGTRPLMILCPFVFLLTRDDVPPLRLQPTEVGSAHWVSLRALVSPSLRTLEYCDISDRLARRGGYVVRAFLRAMLGQMTFAAVQLLPTESVYCSTAGDFLPPTQATSESLLERVEGWWAGSHASSPDPARPLLLWGLTLGILADFLDLFPRTDPSHEPIRFWTYPSFSPADVRLIMWLTTYSFRRKKEREMARAWAEGDGEEERGDVTARVEEGLDVVGGEQRQPAADNQPAKLARDVNNGKRRRRGGSRSSVVVTMLEGYWGLVQRAVIVALLLRGTVGVGVMASLWRIYRRRRGST